MLAHFTVKRHYSGLDASLFVDCEQKEAHVTIKWQRTIMYMEMIGFWEASDPQKAEAWLSRPIGDYPSLMEYLHNRYRKRAA